ncbi:MAG: ATP-binding protein [Bacteroidota bacterium]
MIAIKSSNTLKVLLVEDEPVHQDLITKKFQSYDNIKLRLAKNLSEAKLLVSRSVPDLAIVDYEMPDGKGIELIKTQKRKQFPVVVMANQSNEAQAVQALKSGAFDYVVKSPETLKELPRIAEKAFLYWENINHKRKIDRKIQKQDHQLRKMNAELDRFVYSASHEMRAPLMSVMGLINLSKIEEDNQVQKEYLGMMESCLKRLDKYVKDITDYSRNARMEPTIEKVAPGDVVDAVMKEQSFLPCFAEIRKEIIINDPYELFSDRKRLEIVLNNLISNAIKHHNLEQSDPFLRVELNVKRTKCMISVVDNGIGIGARHLEKIFDMFYKATESSSGSGLGLYITRETVEKLRGTINVRSFLKTGTRFTVVLPNRKPRSKSKAL